jgi:hypothetical protein
LRSTRLTHQYQGRHFRLTDVHGEMVRGGGKLKNGNPSHHPGAGRPCNGVDAGDSREEYRFTMNRRLLLALVLLALQGVCLKPALTAEADISNLELLKLLRRHPGNPVYLDDLIKRMPAITDPAEREVSLAVCALGLLQNEKTPEAIRALNGLASQFPNSPYLKLIQFDELNRVCRRCDGGKTTRSEICPKCNGGRRCLVCGGRGTQIVLNDRRVQCSACGGSGRCLVCKGSGRLVEPCRDCNGRGANLDQRKIRQTAQGILLTHLKAQAPGWIPEPVEDELGEKRREKRADREAP